MIEICRVATAAPPNRPVVFFNGPTCTSGVVLYLLMGQFNYGNTHNTGSYWTIPDCPVETRLICLERGSTLTSRGLRWGAGRCPLCMRIGHGGGNVWSLFPTGTLQTTSLSYIGKASNRLLHVKSVWRTLHP